MLSFYYDTNEDLYNDFMNGRFQNEIYEYLLKVEELGFKINHTNVFDFFEVEISTGEHISSESIRFEFGKIQNTLHQIITSVLSRYEYDMKTKQ